MIMTNTFFKSISRKILILALYQIIGGAFGLALTLNWMYTLSQIQPLLYILIFLAICLMGYSILCGILILLKKDDNLKYSLINQYLQLINFSILGYSFQYVSGVYLFVGIDFTDSFIFKFSTGITTWYLGFNTASEVMQVNLNLCALFMILFIEKLRKQSKEYKAIESIS